MAAISSFQLKMDVKLAPFEEEICQGQEEVAAKMLKWVHYDKPYMFWMWGNEKQVNFNTKVDGALIQLGWNRLGHGLVLTAAVQYVKKAIQKVRLMLEEQPKLVRMADCLEYSWSVVDEYTTDDSTKDSNHKDRLYI